MTTGVSRSVRKYDKFMFGNGAGGAAGVVTPVCGPLRAIELGGTDPEPAGEITCETGAPGAAWFIEVFGAPALITRTRVACFKSGGGRCGRKITMLSPLLLR